jgi:hypothetical protein
MKERLGLAGLRRLNVVKWSGATKFLIVYEPTQQAATQSKQETDEKI